MSTAAPTPPPEPKKPITKRWWFWALIALLAVGLISSLLDQGETTTPAEPENESPAAPAAAPSEDKETTVEVGGQTWACVPVPADVMPRIMEGDKWDDGAHATVEKSIMVEGADNNFVAASVLWEGEKKPTEVSFTYDKVNIGPITSASKGTAELFNWPETPGGPLDGTKAAADCLKKVS